MTINLPAIPGDKVHVVKDGSREYTGIMLGSFSYRYESSQLIVYVMTDQEADRRDRVGKGPNVASRIKSYCCVIDAVIIHPKCYCMRCV